LSIGKNNNQINIICSAIFTSLFTLIVFYLVKNPIVEGNTISIKAEGLDKIENITKNVFNTDDSEEVRINVVNKHRGVAIPNVIDSGYAQ